jgi:anti-anti-sigma factor
MEHHPTKDISIETLGDSCGDLHIIKVRGALTIHNFFDFQDLTRKQSATVLLIDLEEVPYIDSAALGCLIGVHVSCEKAGRSYALVNANERLKKLFSVAGVDRLLVTYDSLADAQTSLCR